MYNSKQVVGIMYILYIINTDHCTKAYEYTPVTSYPNYNNNMYIMYYKYICVFYLIKKTETWQIIFRVFKIADFQRVFNAYLKKWLGLFSVLVAERFATHVTNWDD